MASLLNNLLNTGYNKIPLNSFRQPTADVFEASQDVMSVTPEMFLGAENFNDIPIQDNIGDISMLAEQSSPARTNPKNIARYIQESVGAIQPRQKGLAQEILTRRFQQQELPQDNQFALNDIQQPNLQDFVSAIRQTSMGQPVSATDVATNRNLRLAQLQTQAMNARRLANMNPAGATGELVDRLMLENPNLSYSDALYQVQAGYRQGLQVNPQGQIEPMAGVPQAKEAIKYSEAMGGQKAKIGTTAEIERQKKIGMGEITDIDKKQSGKGMVSNIIGNLRNDYQTLNEMGGITSTTRSPLENIGISARASGAGQRIGRTIGSQEQAQREVIKASIPRLMTAIKSATGMSAQEINSIPEMELLKQSVTDPKMPIEAVNKILDDLEGYYGKGKINSQQLNIPSGALEVMRNNIGNPDIENQFMQKYGVDPKTLF